MLQGCTVKTYRRTFIIREKRLSKNVWSMIVINVPPQNEINNPKFNFLNQGDPYHAYYKHKVVVIR